MTDKIKLTRKKSTPAKIILVGGPLNGRHIARQHKITAGPRKGDVVQLEVSQEIEMENGAKYVLEAEDDRYHYVDMVL